MRAVIPSAATIGRTPRLPTAPPRPRLRRTDPPRARPGSSAARGSSRSRKRWRSEGWTPAQQVNHVVLTYRAMTHDVRDGRRAEFIGTEQQRRRWRLLGLVQIYLRGTLPAGAPAPREVRPPDYSPDRATLLGELRLVLDEFERTMRSAARDRPAHRVAHPYFGWLSLRQAVRISGVHTRHHAAALERSVSGRAGLEA